MVTEIKTLTDFLEFCKSKGKKVQILFTFDKPPFVRNLLSVNIDGVAYKSIGKLKTEEMVRECVWRIRTGNLEQDPEIERASKVRR